MAIFERRAWGKVILDDTQALRISFESTQNVQGHTEYVIRVQRGPDPQRSWLICKRYNDFVGLHMSVVQAAGLPLCLPPKRFLGNMDRNFIAERQTALQTYLNSILMNPILASSLGVRKFLDPESYVLSLQEQAVQHVAMAMRSEVNYELLKPLPDVGWRLRKHYFLVRAKLNPRAEMALQWVEYGPDKFLEERDIQQVLKILTQVTHANVHPLDFAHCSDSGSYVIKLFHSEGSLRDLLCGTKPKSPFLKKYASPKQTRALTLNEVQQFGRQILDALAFLHDKCIPYGHLHSGNIVFVDGQVRLLDVENGVLGLPSYYRPFFVQHKKINTLEAIDVYSFGHVVYEMAVGHPLHESICDNIPSSCPSIIHDVLNLILSSESIRNGMPSIASLQQHPCFNSIRESGQRVAVRISSSLKEALRTACVSIVRRLHSEQKLVRTQKKIAKVQEMMTSEDEIRKRKQRLKEERKANHANNKSVTKKSPPRSDSPTSTSTATSAGTVTPPMPAMKPVLETAIITTENETIGRSAFLNSICAFDKAKLKNSCQKSTNGAAHS